MDRGVYFLANDGVLELAIAFLNSFRLHNPRLPLCLVPFGTGIDGLLSLADRYKFSLFPQPALYERCDIASRLFHDQIHPEYRKLCMWQGPFEEFVYIDIDTIVLADLDPVFDLLREFDFVAGQSNGRLKNVWRESIYSTRTLSNRQIAYAANTGFIASRKGALSLDDWSGRIEAAFPLRHHMVHHTKEQSLLNYLIVTSGGRYTSLYSLSKLRVTYPRVGVEQWAGDGGRIARAGQIADGGQPVLFVHWAGKWKPTWLERLWDWGLQRLGRGPKRSIRRFLPYADLWQHYRQWTLPPERD